MIMRWLLNPLIFTSIFISGCERAQQVQEKIEPPRVEEMKDAFNFFVIGDWGRKGRHNQREVGEQMAAQAELFQPRFIISTGDNFYENGVESIHDPLWNRSFEEVYEHENLFINWYAVLGNHDYRGNPDAQIEYSDKSERWNMPDRYYTFSHDVNGTTSIRFVFIDTNPLLVKYYKDPRRYSDLTEQDTLRQLRWIDSVLAGSSEQWKIVIGHHPIYSSGSRHGDIVEMKEKIKPLLEKYHVQVYLAGHDHDLQHLQDGGYVDYVVSGAGSETRSTGSTDQTVFTKAVSGFSAISVRPDTLELYHIDYRGDIIYKYKRGR